MKIELTKEQILILKELCFSARLQMCCQKLDNQFIDKKQIETYIDKLKELQDILIVEDESEV